MTREEWQRIKTVSAAALERPESERPDYIAAQCSGDPAFEREVTSLVSFSARASDLFETNSFALPAAAADIMSPASGRTSSGLLARLEGAAPRRFHSGDLVNGRYSVESLAGEGGMGAVYRVVDTATGRTLALKTIGGRVRSVNLFKIEFRTLVELAHPHLARSYDFEPIAGGDDYFFTMDFVDGASIYDATAAAPWPRVVELVVQLCRALAYVHNRGVTHRDLKPNNVLVQRDSVVKLVDFGLAGIDDDLKDAIGTPSYLAPEVRAANRGDHRADLYSLGILTYQLLTRRLPFTGADLDELLRQHAYAPVIWPDRVELPTWLKEIVTKLCAKQPSDRFRGANQVIESLNERGGLDYPVETAATRDSYVLSGRFVGRQAELDALSAFVTGRLAAGSGDSNPMAFVAGASGVGKSRLMRELRHRLQLDRQTFVEAHCFEGAAAEYGALAEAIAQLVPIAEACGGFDITGRYLGHLVKIAPDVERRGVAPAPALATPEAERARLFDAIAGFLIELSSRRPFVLFVDDAQWAPHGTVEILAYVRRRIVLAEQRGDHVRLALVAAYRDEEAAGRPIESLLNEARSGARTLGLEPLRPEAMERLLVSMFGLDDVPRAFVSRVLDEAAGSPFFLEEVVRGLVENGSVFVDGGEWRTASELGALEIPATVIAALRRRLAMIDSAEAFDVLRLLAVHKKPMSAELLAAVAGRPAHAIDEELYELSRRHMIVAVDASERLFRTVHDYLRTTVYDDLGDDVRGVHLRIATGLERAADAGNPRLSELAHHYWAGGDRDQALKYSLLAGRSALKMYANDEAIEYLERALDLLPPEQAEVRAETVEQLADACFLAGRYHRAETLLTQLGGDAAAALDRVRIQRKRAELVGYSAGTPGKAVDILWDAARQLGARRPSRAMFVPRTVTALARHFAQRSTSAAIPRARDDGERRRLAELAATYLRIGYFSFFSDPVLLVLPVTRAANLVDRIPDSEEYSRVYAMMAITVAGLGLEARALRYGREAIEQAARSGSPLQVANARSFHALVLLQTGHWAEALDHAERACSSLAAAGDHFQLAVSAVAMVEVLHERGDLAAARARAQEQVAVFDRLELQMIGKGLYTVYGRVLANTGDPEGIAVGRRVLALAEQGSDTLSTVFAEVALGDSLLELGREDEAIEHLERGLSIRDRDGFDVYVVAQGSALLARAYAAQVRRANARLTGAVRRTFERRVRQAVRVGRRFAPMRSAACLSRGLSCTLSGRHQEAMRWFEDAARLASALGARVWEADAHFENGLAILAHEGGRSRRARAELSLAQSLYSSCGAVPGEHRATDALAGLAGAATV